MNFWFLLSFASFTSAASIYANNNYTQLPDDVEQAVHEQVMIDFSNITGTFIHGKHVNIPKVHINADALHNIMQAQSARQNALLSVQKKVMVAQEEQESLNRRFRSGEYTDEFLLDYAQGSGNQTKQVVDDVTNTMRPYTTVLRHAVGNFLLAPYLSSVTEGSRLYSNALGRMTDNDAETRSTAHQMTTHYIDLAHLGQMASLNYNDLQYYTQNIIKELKL